MKVTAWLAARGFKRRDEQPVGATDLVGFAGIFRVRVRIPLPGCAVEPQLWVGFAVGGPLVERPSTMKYRDAWKLAEDALALRRVLSGH